MNKTLYKLTAIVLILGMASIANAQNWNLSGNTLTGSERFGSNNDFDLTFYTDSTFRMNLTKTGWLGLGISQPRGWMEVNYCPPPLTSQVGSIITLHKCHGDFVMPSHIFPDFIGGAITPIDTSLSGSGGGGSGGPFVIPINFATGNLTNLVSPLYGTESPMFWVRKQIPQRHPLDSICPHLGDSNSISWGPISWVPDKFDTKFIVMPDGSCGINIAKPRAALDVRGSNAPNRPAAIFGSRALGTGYKDPMTGLFQYYTQQIHLVPVLKTNGYNRITQQGDQGLFFTDGKGASGANSLSALVIAPWAASGDTCVGGMRMDANGNTEFHGTLRAIKLKTEAKWWSDFVFSKEYKLRTIEELDTFIQLNDHLPDVPSEKEVLENGLDVANMQAIQQQKIEELTLYVIQLKKEIEAMKSLIEQNQEVQKD